MPNSSHRTGPTITPTSCLPLSHRATFKPRGVGRYQAILMLAGVLCTACSSPFPAKQQFIADAYESVLIRRTTDDIPHVRAQSWHGLGYGQGYAQAEDALCTLAEGFITVSGQRSLYFGPDERPHNPSTLGQERNLDMDIFFQAFADAPQIAAFRLAQPDTIRQLVAGYADGYNRYLAEQHNNTGPQQQQRHACVLQPWVQAIDVEYVYRRMFALNLIAGYGNFIPEIVNAEPPTPASAGPSASLPPTTSLSYRIHAQIAGDAGLGSNLLAFGEAATGEAGTAVLFGNPHWFWSGIDRFYQVHLNIPGQINAAGVSFLGVPILMIGFNENVAWTHTVSKAKRFGLFDLQLDPDNPLQYVVDGKVEPMQRRTVTIKTKQATGEIRTVTRTLFRTRFGPVIDLGGAHPAFSWRAGKALAIRDINEHNSKAYTNFLQWSQARSLDEFISIQKSISAMPWVNTSAIGRNDGRVWFADVGAVPNAPDELRQRCRTELSEAFASFDRTVPVLDASRSECDWVIDGSASLPGGMPADQLPSLLRTDYVANMNDSYWLTQPRQPLEGYPANLGGERTQPSLRSLEGHHIAQSLMDVGTRYAHDFSAYLREAVLASRAYSADRWKAQILSAACQPDRLAATAHLYRQQQDEQATSQGSDIANLQKACNTLSRWSNQARPQDKGVLLWDAVWRHLQASQKNNGALFEIPFSPNTPLDTPDRIQVSPEHAGLALMHAIAELQGYGIDFQAPLSRQRVLAVNDQTIPLYGGCADTGYFTIGCTLPAHPQLDANIHANTYLQVVHFDRDDQLRAYTLLAHGQDERTLITGQRLNPVQRYALKDWLRFPLAERDISSDATIVQTSLSFPVPVPH